MPRPLRSTGVTPLPRYYEPLRLPCLQPAAYSFAACLVASPQPVARVSQPAQPNFPCALSPLTPESSGIALKRLFTPDDWLQPFWKSGRSHLWFNEADSGSLALRLTGLFHGASTQRLLTALSLSLHARRSVGMMNTFQFISCVGGAGAPEETNVTLGGHANSHAINRLCISHRSSGARNSSPTA
jgi:hypothetical protein